MKYDFTATEKKWQKRWEASDIFHASDDLTKKKYYALVEFPYPSGAGLHCGHPRPYTALDIVARKRRMQGYNVLFPMGWDADVYKRQHRAGRLLPVLHEGLSGRLRQARA